MVRRASRRLASLAGIVHMGTKHLSGNRRENDYWQTTVEKRKKSVSKCGECFFFKHKVGMEAGTCAAQAE